MPYLFAVTLFVAAFLLFAVQPMLGRMLLPKVGGSPAVWNACLVFFQGTLLLGYLYSHALTRWPVKAGQAGVQLVLLIGALTVLPMMPPVGDPGPGSPALWVLATLAVQAGWPFFAVATLSPLLQRWYSWTGAVRAGDPYFLSIASNAGCLTALLVYPIVIEPSLELNRQADFWRWGYVALLGLTGACGFGFLRGVRVPATTAEPADSVRTPGRGAVSWSDRIRWLIYAALPASLLVGVTQAITTDIAPIPLFWVIPLALYLLTFMAAFWPGLLLPQRLLGKLLAMSVLFLALALLVGATSPLWLVMTLHLMAFVLACLVCHGRLAAERPAPEHLTGFYLVMSLGGVLGGAFNTVAAPLLFQRLGYAEYPLVLILVTMVRPWPPAARQFGWLDVLAPVLVGLVTLGLISVGRQAGLQSLLEMFSEWVDWPADWLRRGLLYGVPLILAYVLVERPIRFVLGLAAIFLAAMADVDTRGRTMRVERSFLGVIRIAASPDGQFVKMYHGNTVHGQQRREPRPRYIAASLQAFGAAQPLPLAIVAAVGDGRWDDRRRPLTYYHPTGPAGVTFRFLVDGWPGPRRVAAVGLGTGALASYARPNQDWTFYELDPLVERLARDDRFFTYLRDAQAGSLRVVLGDARLRLAEAPDHSFDLIVLDAFSSDAIPVHLLTREAFTLYERKLAPGGVILIHLSNRYLALAGVVGRVAASLDCPLVMRLNEDTLVTEREEEDGKFISDWAIFARADADFGPLVRPIRGFRPYSPPPGPLWTDQHANVLEALTGSP